MTATRGEWGDVWESFDRRKQHAPVEVANEDEGEDVFGHAVAAE